MLAKADQLAEVVSGQRLTIDFVVSSGVAKSIRLNFLIPGSLVRVQPGVFEKHWEMTGLDFLFGTKAKATNVDWQAMKVEGLA